MLHSQWDTLNVKIHALEPPSPTPSPRTALGGLEWCKMRKFSSIGSTSVWQNTTKMDRQMELCGVERDF